jgi:hypothetical protein
VLSITAAGLVAAGAPALAATSTGAPRAAANDFEQTNLIASNASFHPKLVDPNLTNAWGLAAGTSTPLWVSDNNSGNATVYSGGINGSAVSLDLTVPVPGGNPTGQVFNTAFGGPSAVVFSSGPAGYNDGLVGTLTPVSG